MKPTPPKMILKRHFSAVFDQLSPYLINISTEKFPCNKIDKTTTFTLIPPHVTILKILEATRISQDGMVDEVSGNIIADLRKKGTFGVFSDQRIQSLREGMWNKIEYDLKDLQKLAVQLE